MTPVSASVWLAHDSEWTIEANTHMDNRTEPTSLPPLTPRPHTAQVFLCPVCECELEYEGSRAPSPAQPAELNDYFRCPAGCGTFEHERKAHRMRLFEPA